MYEALKEHSSFQTGPVNDYSGHNVKNKEIQELLYHKFLSRGDTCLLMIHNLQMAQIRTNKEN
jgi:hypothetical protein